MAFPLPSASSSERISHLPSHSMKNSVSLVRLHKLFLPSITTPGKRPNVELSLTIFISPPADQRHCLEEFIDELEDVGQPREVSSCRQLRESREYGEGHDVGVADGSGIDGGKYAHGFFMFPRDKM